MTDQRKVIAKVLSGATDHPDAEELYARASAIDANISLATIYRTVRLFTEACLLYTSPSPRDKRQSRMPSSA